MYVCAADRFVADTSPGMQSQPSDDPRKDVAVVELLFTTSRHWDGATGTEMVPSQAK